MTICLVKNFIYFLGICVCLGVRLCTTLSQEPVEERGQKEGSLEIELQIILSPHMDTGS